MGRFRGSRSTTGGRVTRTAACAFAVTIGISSATQAASDASEDKHASLLQGPIFERALEREVERVEALLAERDTPQGQAELAESETAYEDQSASEAIETISETQKDFVLEPAWNPLEIKGEADPEVERYLTPRAARVDVPGQSVDALVESTVALQTRDESGDLAPTDHSLVDEAEGWEPENALAEVAIPERADQEFELSDIDMGVRAQAATAAEGQLVEDTVVYANAAGPDADLLAKPVPGGMEIAWTLRSGDSPENYALEFDLPPGVSLVEASDERQGAVVAGAGEQLAFVPPPVATDADGLPVELSWRVEGNRLEIDVPHRSQEQAFPILVDPLIIQNQALYDDTSFSNGFADWTPYRTQSNFFYGSGQTGVGWGLEMGGWSWPNHYPYLSQVNWSQNAPGTKSHIFYGTFSTVSALGAYQGNGIPYSWVMEGISYGSSWEQAWAGNGNSPTVRGGNINPNQTTSHCLTPCGRPVHNDNSMQLTTFVNPGGYAPGNFWTYLGGAATWIGDTELPATRVAEHRVSGSVVDAPDGWYDDEVLSVAAEAQDLGLGVKSYHLNAPGLPAQSVSRSCTGGAGSRCTDAGYLRSHPAGQGFSYSTAAQSGNQMPEGRNTVSVTAKDVVGNVSTAASWPVRVDRSAPTITQVEGPLHNQRTELLSSRQYELEVDATDGLQGAGAAAERSGVEALQVFVDGQPLQLYDEYTDEMRPVQETQECVSSGGSCPMSATFTIPGYALGAGSHTVEVRAFDKLGHLSTSSFAATVKEDTQEPQLQVTKSTPAPDGSFSVQISASDSAPPGEWASGVETLEVFADGEEVESFSQSCAPPDQACGMQRTVSFPAGSGEPELAIDVYDRAGNGNLEISGAHRGRFDRFGYNELRELGAQAAGGADTVRFPVDWCGIQPVDPAVAGPDPQAWNWIDYDNNFDALSDHNDGPATTDLGVIAVMVGSPAWANQEADNTACQHDPNTGDNTPPASAEPPETGRVDEYGAFIAAVLDRYGPACEAPQGAPASCAYPGRDTGMVAVQIWNEPNLYKFWGKQQPGNFEDDPTFYARMVEEGADRVSAYNQAHGTDLVVLAGGLSPIGTNPQRFWEDATNPSKPAFIQSSSVDVVAVHLYANNASNAKEARQLIDARYQQVLDGLPNTWNQAGSAKPLWITEVGFPSILPAARVGQLPAASEQRQRKRLAQAYWKYAWKERVKAFIVHRMVDDPAEPRGFGVLRQDLSRKQIYCDLADWVEFYQEPLSPSCP